MSRQDLADVIVAAANDCGGYVFGGYVRDLVAGETFNDIDVFLPGRDVEKLNAYLDLLKAQGYEVRTHRFFEYYMIPLIKRARFFVQESNSPTYVYMDVILSLDQNNPYPFRKDQDGDVNYLYIDNGNIMVAEVLEESLADVLDNIKTFMFFAAESVSDFRIKKLEAKGYSRSYVKPRNVISRACPKCKGTGKLDFGFYTRTCDCILG